MAFHHHRKLIFDNSTTKTKTCSSYYCNPNEKHSGICPISCVYICYPTCSIPFFSEIQPALPPNSATTVIPQSIHYKPTVSNLSIILISFLTTCFFLFCCFTAYRFQKSRISQRQQQAQEEEEEEHEQEFSDIVDEDMVDHPIWYIRTIGLQPSVISAITICKYKRGQGLIEGTDCSVCLNEFQQDETLRILPKCNHAFHLPCIDTWLTSHTNCPMCRAGIVIATAPQQDSGLRHEEEEEGHSRSLENATELRIEIENQSESLDVRSIMDISGNTKENVGNGNNTLTRSASLESSSRSSMPRASCSNSWIEQWVHQNSSEVSKKIDEAGKPSLYAERGKHKEYTTEVYRRSQSAALLR